MINGCSGFSVLSLLILLLSWIQCLGAASFSKVRCENIDTNGILHVQSIASSNDVEASDGLCESVSLLRDRLENVIWRNVASRNYPEEGVLGGEYPRKSDLRAYIQVHAYWDPEARSFEIDRLSADERSNPLAGVEDFRALIHHSIDSVKHKTSFWMVFMAKDSSLLRDRCPIDDRNSAVVIGSPLFDWRVWKNSEELCRALKAFQQRVVKIYGKSSRKVSAASGIGYGSIELRLKVDSTGKVMEVFFPSLCLNESITLSKSESFKKYKPQHRLLVGEEVCSALPELREIEELARATNWGGTYGGRDSLLWLRFSLDFYPNRQSRELKQYLNSSSVQGAAYPLLTSYNHYRMNGAITPSPGKRAPRNMPLHCGVSALSIGPNGIDNRFLPRLEAIYTTQEDYNIPKRICDFWSRYQWMLFDSIMDFYSQDKKLGDYAHVVFKSPGGDMKVYPDEGMYSRRMYPGQMRHIYDAFNQSYSMGGGAEMMESLDAGEEITLVVALPEKPEFVETCFSDMSGLTLLAERPNSVKVGAVDEYSVLRVVSVERLDREGKACFFKGSCKESPIRFQSIVNAYDKYWQSRENAIRRQSGSQKPIWGFRSDDPSRNGHLKVKVEVNSRGQVAKVSLTQSSFDKKLTRQLQEICSKLDWSNSGVVSGAFEVSILLFANGRQFRQYEQLSKIHELRNSGK